MGWGVALPTSTWLLVTWAGASLSGALYFQWVLCRCTLEAESLPRRALKDWRNDRELSNFSCLVPNRQNI